jgi:putative oxidoreductase
VLAIITEFFAPIALALGLFTRVAALGLVVQMLVAARFHLANGFFMNWTGTQAGEGFEYHILAIGLGLALVVMGGGRASLDRRIHEATRS